MTTIAYRYKLSVHRAFVRLFYISIEGSLPYLVLGLVPFLDDTSIQKYRFDHVIAVEICCETDWLYVNI